MLEKIKEIILEKKLTTVKSCDLVIFLKKNFKNEDLLYENFIKFLNIEDKRISSKSAKLFIWFELLSKEKQINFLENNTEFFLNPNFVREFFKGVSDKDILAKIFKNHIKQKRKVFDAVKEINPQRGGIFSDFFDMDDKILETLKHSEIKEDIKYKGDDYLRFFLDMKAVDKTQLIWNFNYYNTFIHIFENSKKITIPPSDFLTGMICVGFHFDTKNEEVEKLFSCLVVDDNPKELEKMRNLVSIDTELQILYESVCLKKMISKSPMLEDSNNKRKRL